MKNIVISTLALVVAAPATAQIFEVVPNDRENAAGNGTFLFFTTSTTGRGYQFLINENQLTNLQGLDLNGISWRLPMSATSPYPTTETTVDAFDIWLSEGVAPANRSLTFSENVVGPQTQVRAGSLTIPAESYPATGTPREWGHEIAFDPWTYAGGHLLIEVRFTAFPVGRSLDAMTATGGMGYDVDFGASWGTGYNTTGGSRGNFVISRLSAVPEPGTMLALGAGLAFLASRRRRK